MITNCFFESALIVTHMITNCITTVPPFVSDFADGLGSLIVKVGWLAGWVVGWRRLRVMSDAEGMLLDCAATRNVTGLG